MNPGLHVKVVAEQFPFAGQGVHKLFPGKGLYSFKEQIVQSVLSVVILNPALHVNWVGVQLLFNGHGKQAVFPEVGLY